MAYITYEQYTELYGTPPIPEDAFPMYAGQASDLIDSITQYRIIQGGGLSALPAFVQTLVQKATAAQVLYFTQQGMETVLTGETGQAFSVGLVSVSGGGRAADSNATAASRMISPLAVLLLEQTPLLERRVAVCSDQFPGFF